MTEVIITIVLATIILLGVLLFAKKRDVAGDMAPLDPEEAKTIAREWINGNVATYLFDGNELRFLDAEKLQEGKRYRLTFSFASRTAGYGDRAGQSAAQAITPHIMEIVIENGKVVSAITDGDYDEIKKAFIEPETKIIIVYFIEKVEGREETVEVVREVPSTAAVERTAIEELLKGPSIEEKALGLSTLIPKGTKLLSISIQDGIARVDFSRELQKGVRGSGRILAVRNQIEKTLAQFDSIDKMILLVEGKSECVLQS